MTLSVVEVDVIPDPLTDERAAESDDRVMRRAMLAERRALLVRALRAQADAAWFASVARWADKAAERFDARDTGDGLSLADWRRARAAGTRSAHAEGEAETFAADADHYRATAVELARLAGAPLDPWACEPFHEATENARERRQRKAKGARLRALRSIERDAYAWALRLGAVNASGESVESFESDEARAAWVAWWNAADAADAAQGVSC